MANGAQILTIILESIAAKVHIKPTSCSPKDPFHCFYSYHNSKIIHDNRLP